MRKLVEFNEEGLGYGLVKLLNEQGIEAQVLESNPKEYSVWVLDDHLVTQSQVILTTFLAQPQLARPTQAAPVSSHNPASRQRIIPVRQEVWNRQPEKKQTLTFALIAVCSVIFICLQIPELEHGIRYLYYSEYLSPRFVEIKQGQVWRLITPILLHFGWIHIIFNMLWVYQLGTYIETIGGTSKLLALTLFSGALSNLLQYLVGGPLFGGMSGVIYALLGYAWAMGRWQPQAGYHIDKGTFGFMMVWLVLCFMGLFGPVANFAHLGGLVAGCLWAARDARFGSVQK